MSKHRTDRDASLKTTGQNQGTLQTQTSLLLKSEWLWKSFYNNLKKEAILLQLFIIKWLETINCNFKNNFLPNIKEINDIKFIIIIN